MAGFIITFRLDTSTQNGADTYNERLKALLDYFKEVSETYKEDDTTSTVYINAQKPIHNASKKVGLAYEIINRKILHNNDIVKFHKLNELKLEVIGYIEKNEYKTDQKSFDILK